MSEIADKMGAMRDEITDLQEENAKIEGYFKTAGEENLRLMEVCRDLEIDRNALRIDLSAARTEIARLRAELEPIQGVMNGISKAWTDPADAVACEGT